ncbi:MAG: hypothetical protein ACYS1A_03830 [Planctomycetota bacterium]
MNNPEGLVILRSFTDILEQLGIAYAIGGSMASSIYGSVRFTEDADITVEPFDKLADKFFEMLTSEYYISREAMYQALRQQGCFNVIHMSSAFKIDMFIRKNSAFEEQLMARRKQIKLCDSWEKLFPVVSPEDIILLKLQWYRDGGCSSERQWNDVLGVLMLQAERLDLEYLNNWADNLQISELLKKAILEAKQ